MSPLYTCTCAKKKVTMKCTIICCCCRRCRCCAKFVNEFSLFVVSIFSPWFVEITIRKKTKRSTNNNQNLSFQGLPFCLSPFFAERFFQNPKRRSRKKSKIDDANSISYCVYCVYVVWHLFGTHKNNRIILSEPILLILFRYCLFFLFHVSH